MTKKRTRPAQISDRKKRNDVLSKRLESLTKKADDLSILCGVDIGIVIQKPTEDNPVLWPSPEIFEERMHRFLDFPEMELKRKMVLHHKYLEERYKDEREDLLKFQKKKKMIESQMLMNELSKHCKAFDEVDIVQLKALQCFTTEMLKKLQKRDNELNNESEL